MPSLRQTSFASGELSPFNWGRSDRPEFAKGARTLKNFLISKDGPAVSRPGTLLVRESKPILLGGYTIRLIPFVISDTESYVLEFGDLYIRFHRSGATVLSGGALATSPTTGTPEELVTTYAWSQVNALQYAQVGTELHLVHPEHPERILTFDGSTWSLNDETYLINGAYFADILGTGDQTVTPHLVSAAGGTTFFYADHPVREWLWAVSASVRNIATGETFETKAEPVTKYYDGVTPGTAATMASGPGNFVVLYPDAPIVLRRFLTGLPDPLVGFFEIVTFNYYRGRGGIYGFVGSSKELDFVDTGSEPDYAIQPLLGQLPLREVSSSVVEFPSTIGFFQERRILAGSAERPSRLITSATGNYDDFDKHTVAIPGQSLEFELATRYRESIRWLLGQRQLLIGTDSSIWALSGTESDVLDTDAFYARPIDNVGSEAIQPFVIGPTVFYVRAKGRGVRALVPGQNGYEGRDASQHASHLFVGGDSVSYGGGFVGALFGSVVTKKIIDWCYAEDPWGVAWVAREDGVLLSMTLSPGGDVGWARHEMDGEVIAMCSVPEGIEDGVYLAVNRTIDGDERVFIERMTSRVQNNSAEDDACVDCCRRYQTAPQLTYTGLDHLEGKEVWAVSVGNPPYGPLTVTGGSITLPELPAVNLPAYVPFGTDYVVMFIGLAYVCDLESLDFPPDSGRLRQKTVTHVGFEVSQSRGVNFGQDFEHLDEWEQRQVADSYGASSASTELVKVPVAGTHDFFARAALRQTLPLPVTVLGLVREVSAGD